MTKATRIAERAQYLGGLHDAHPASGSLVADETCMGIGGSSPKKGVVPWAAISSISLDSGVMKKSRAGAYVKYGVVGALAPGTEVSADLAVRLKDGTVVRYRIPGLSGLAVGVALKPFASTNGISFVPG